MSKRDRAEYMRDYRARERLARERAASVNHDACDRRIAELEAELREAREVGQRPSDDIDALIK